MKIIVAPDSFKGSLSAVNAAHFIEAGIKNAESEIEVIKIPMADGGEGTVEAVITAVGGEIRHCAVTGPLGNEVDSFYGILSDGKTAIIEMAAASGLTLVPQELRNPMITTSYGTGELIKKAVEAGCSRLIIGIGGSSTNDGGMGMAQALGVRFFDDRGNELGMGGLQLNKIFRIDISNMLDFTNVEVTVACDVKNPLCGPEGASAVFGPQKGATDEMVTELDNGLRNFADKIRETSGKSITNIPGSGAAGGMGGGLVAFLDAFLQPGINIMKDLLKLEAQIKNADLVITGEGRTDSQTLYGKVPFGIAQIAKQYGIPVICISGSIGSKVDQLYDYGITGIFSIIDQPMSLSDAMDNAGPMLQNTTGNIIRMIKAFGYPR
jgi:glycerate kinase